MDEIIALATRLRADPAFKAQVADWMARTHRPRLICEHSTIAFIAQILHATLNQELYDAGHDIPTDFFNALLDAYETALSARLEPPLRT